jgi:uncharacterized protein YjhX (UPF0386 family)
MATPAAVAMMLIAALATDNLSEIDDRIQALAKRRAIDPETGKPGRCRFTGKHTLHEALTEVLTYPEASSAESICIEVTRKAKTARLIRSSSGAHRISEFGKAPLGKGVEVKATFADLFLLSRELENVST